jgi:hypothetical protein
MSLYQKIYPYFDALRSWVLQTPEDFNRDKTLSVIADIQSQFSFGSDSQSLSRQEAILRCLAQYRAQKTLRPGSALWIAEFVSILMLPWILFWFLLWPIFSKPHSKRDKSDGYFMMHKNAYRKNEAVYIVPPSLDKEYDVRKTLITHRRFLTLRDLGLSFSVLVACFRHAESFPVQLLLKTAKNLSFGRKYINAFDADFGLVAIEYNCCLSLLTYQHHQEGRALYNVMHGDKASSVMDSFFAVDRCYCWHDFYAGLFKEQGAQAEFVIDPPALYQLKDNPRTTNEGTFVGIILPHLKAFNIHAAEKATLKEQIEAFAENYKGQRVIMRLHPLCTSGDLKWAQSVSGVEVMQAQEMTTQDFVRSCTALVGMYSSVLLEGALHGKDVVYFECQKVKELKKYHFVFDLPNVSTMQVPL